MKKLELNTEAFMKHIDQEMNWNVCTIRQMQTEEVKRPGVLTDSELMKEAFDIKPGEWKTAFYYTCMPGSGVANYLKEAIRKFDKNLKFRIRRFGDCSRRAWEHEYMIIITNT